MGADLLAGQYRKGDSAWLRVYRALDHGAAKRALERTRKARDLSDVSIEFCILFEQLQEERHRADYDPTVRYRREEVLGRIGRAREVLGALKRLDRAERPELVTRCLFRDRP